MTRRFTWPVSWLVGAAYVVLGISDGFHHLRKTYHPIQDFRTYRTWRHNRKAAL